MSTLDLLDIETIKEINHIGLRIEHLMQDKEDMTQSDYQGALDAIIISAMLFKREG